MLSSSRAISSRGGREVCPSATLMTRTCTGKLEKLGVNPVPLVLSPGDLCMVRESDAVTVTLCDVHVVCLSGALFGLRV